jgi:transmembrane sensor
MREMNNIERFTEKEWETLASFLSDEQKEQTNLLNRFMSEDSHNTIQKWKELRIMSDKKEINVDKAWDKLYSRVKESGAATVVSRRLSIINNAFLKIAAVALIVLGIGSALLYLDKIGAFSKRITVFTNNDEMNLQVKLPDGSNIFLNRNTKLSYKANLGKSARQVTLSGEAFFEITPDASSPFTVNAGTATIRVLGTSFNVISENVNSAVEVFVKSGKVMLSDNSGSQNMVLDPGFVGTIDSKHSDKILNSNANYMSWNTGKLTYESQTLNVVFHDLKRIFNVEIVTDDPDILNQLITTNFDNEPIETKIRIICTTFNLSYKKDGDIYNLKKNN